MSKTVTQGILAPEAQTPPESAKTGPLHTWIDGDGRDIWHYCQVCKVVRYPNGKLDAQICPGPAAPRIKPKYVKSDKSASAKTKPASKAARRTKANPAQTD
jgi:hypothetical protein